MTAVINPVPREKAAPEVHEIYDNLTKKIGRMPNLFATMAHKPDLLAKFVPFYWAVTGAGSVEPRYKEFAYLKTAMLNGCEY